MSKSRNVEISFRNLRQFANSTFDEKSRNYKASECYALKYSKQLFLDLKQKRIDHNTAIPVEKAERGRQAGREKKS